MARLLLSLLAAGGMLALSGCGSSGGSTSASSTAAETVAKTVGVDAYAGTVCSALSEWLNNLQNASAVFANSTNDEDDLRKVRAQFVTFFGGAIDETDRMVAEVEGAGVPDVANGAQVSAEMLRELGTFRPLLVDAQGRARQLPVDKPVKFTKLAQTLGAGFRIETTKLETVFELLGKRYKTPELTRAAQADANCRDLSP